MTLEELVETSRNRPFKWGTHDCYQFASKALEAQTGKGLPQSKPYRTAKGAFRRYTEFYRGSPEAYLDAAYMRLPKGVIPPSGGLVLRVYDDPNFKYIFGICLDSRVVFPGADGLEFTDIDFDKDTFWVT